MAQMQMRPSSSQMQGIWSSSLESESKQKPFQVSSNFQNLHQNPLNVNNSSASRYKEEIYSIPPKQ